MKWGDFELHLISDGRFRLDGGSMFGVVPRVLWEKKVSPDEKHRIPLGLNCLLIQTGARNILIDTGCGYKYSDKEMQIYQIEHPTDVLKELRRFEVLPEEIDIVINTHFHFDHCGGNTCLHNGEVVPAFPNATYLVRRKEFEDADHPNERTSATYFHHNWRPIQERGKLRLIDRDEEVVSGITVMHTPGHTAGHQSVKVVSGGKTLFFLADLCPTTAHVPLPWIMGFDTLPLTTLEVRKNIYPQALQEQWLLFFEHDPQLPAGYLREEKGKYIVEPATWKE